MNDEPKEKFCFVISKTSFDVTEPVTQSKISQKEKKIYMYILVHICGIWKNGTEGTYFQGRNGYTDAETGHGDPAGEEEGRTNWEIRADVCTPPCVKIDS